MACNKGKIKLDEERLYDDKEELYELRYKHARHPPKWKSWRGTYVFDAIGCCKNEIWTSDIKSIK